MTRSRVEASAPSSSGHAVLGAHAVEAVVLTGGRARRLGGVRKDELDIGRGPLLAGELDALRAAGVDRAIVVGPGPRRALAGLDVLVVREDPPYGGPVAALATALPLLHRPWTLLLAGDLPASDRLVPLLLAGWRRVAATDPSSAGVVVQDGGRPQWLAGVYARHALRSALSAAPSPVPAADRARAEPPRGPGLGSLLGPLHPHRLDDPDGASRDLDTPEDLTWWVEHVSGQDHVADHRNRGEEP